MMPKSCPVCRHPELLAKIERGEMTFQDVANELGVSRSYVWYCYTHHYKAELTETQSADFEYAEDLKELIRLLKDRVFQVVRDTSIHDRPTAWIAQLRGCIHDLAELEGRLQKAPLIQLNQLKVQFEELTMFLLKELPPEYQQKVLEFLEKKAKARQVTA